MINKMQLIEEVHRLLDQTGIPSVDQASLLNRMLDNTRYDMDLKMDIMEHSARFFMFERGAAVFEKYVEDEQAIQYIILENIISSYFSISAYKEHVMSNGDIDIKWEARAKADAFAKVGDPYLSMFEKKITVYNI